MGSIAVVTYLRCVLSKRLLSSLYLAQVCVFCVVVELACSGQTYLPSRSLACCSARKTLSRSRMRFSYTILQLVCGQCPKPAHNTRTTSYLGKRERERKKPTEQAKQHTSCTPQQFRPRKPEALLEKQQLRCPCGWSCCGSEALARTEQSAHL